MGTPLVSTDEVTAWLRRCLGRDDTRVISTEDAGGHSGCLVLRCTVEVGESVTPIVLKVYRTGFDDYSALGPVGAARKHALALSELPTLRVPTPRCLGVSVRGDEVALAIEAIHAKPWPDGTRADAARILARLHCIQMRKLSDELAALVARSTPNRGRVGSAPEEPPLQEQTLQHGDYFSVNIFATADGIRVLDWDLLALGDPMWDLGHLLEADRGLSEAEAAAVIQAYQQVRPLDEARLRWQRACWRQFRETRQRTEAGG